MVTQNTFLSIGTIVLILMSFGTVYAETFLTEKDIEALGTDIPETMTAEDIKKVQIVLGVILILLGTLCITTSILIYLQNKKIKKGEESET